MRTKRPCARSHLRARSVLATAATGIALLASTTLPVPAVAPAAQAQPAIHIAFTGYAASNAYTQAALTGVNTVAAKYHATVHFYDPEMSSTTQVAQVEDAAASGKYNAMVLYSVDGIAIVPAAKQAIAAGLKVVADFVPIGPSIDTTATQVPGLVGDVVVPIDLTGTYAGELVVQACAGLNPCRVAYLPGDNTLPLEIDRTNHVMAVLKAHKNIDVVAVVQSGYAPGTGKTAGEDVITAHHNVNVIASSNDQAIVGVALALNQAHLLGKVKLIGGGGTYQAIAGIKNGTWFGTVNYCPTREAEFATQMAINAVLHRPLGPTHINSLTICGAPAMLTKANVGSYAGEWSAG